MARVRYKWRIVGFIFKAICGLFIAAVVLLLFWRMISNSNDPKEMDTLIPNKILADTYAENNGKLDIFYQNQGKHTRGENNSGYFTVTQSAFIPQADQLQFVFRYNNSTLKYTYEDYFLPAIPSRDEEVYDVSVTIMYDLTPENEADNDGKTPEAVEYVRFFPSDMRACKRDLYNYRKFVFDNIEINDRVLAIYADFYYVGDIDYNEKPYGSLLLYYYTERNIDYKLSIADREAIEKFEP